MGRRLIEALRELRRSERGFALPVAVTVTFVGLGLASVPVLASINTQQGDSHSQGSNQALAAAEAGANIALLRQSQMMSSTSAAKPCVGVAGEKLEAQGMLTSGSEATWCAQVTMTSTSSPAPPSGTEVVYHVMPCFHQGGASSGCSQLMSCESTPKSYGETEENLIRIVSEGTAYVAGRSVKARVSVTGCSQEEKKVKITETETTPPNVFAAGNIVGVEWIKLNNNAQVYNGGIGTNGEMKEMVGSANVCGTVRYGTSYVKPNNGSENPPANCAAGRTFVQGITEYPPVSLPDEIATKNSNWRICTELACHKGADPVGSEVWERGNISWDASNRQLTVNYNQLTLEGTEPYFLCRLVLAGGSKLLMGAGKTIRIFFDSPANCPGLNGAAQLQIANGAYVGPDAANGPGFYFVGSETANASKIELGGGATVSQFVVYAPKSTIVANNGVNLSGAIIGRTLELGGGASINKSGTVATPPPGEFLATTKTKTEEITHNPKSFTRQSYVQCTSSGALGSGC